MIPNCAAPAMPISFWTAPARSTSTRPTWTTGPSLPTTSPRPSHQPRHRDRAEAATWKPGEVLLLTGKLAHRSRRRPQAHDRHAQSRRKLPVDFHDRFIYYVGPVDPVREEVVGPAGPTTATRMDKFTRQMLAETGLLAW